MRYIFTLLFSLIAIVKINAQSISNEGTEFWLCFPSHVPATNQGNAELSVFITSKNNTSGTVTCGSFSQTFNVVANTVTEVPVSRAASYIFNGTGISPNKGIKVQIDSGKPKAAVYGHIFAGARSAATLVLPKLALGQKYFAVSYEQNEGRSIGNSQMDIVCVEPNTTIKVTPRVNGALQPVITVNLVNVGDVYQYQNSDDITGTYVEVDAGSSSCKRFAAFSGSSALAILSPGCNPPGGPQTGSNPSYDPLLQQLYPLESWGTVFPLIPFFDRNTGAIFRVLASEDNTTISIGTFRATINKGQYYQPPSPINTASVITANKPVMVTQYALTQYCADSRNRGNNARPSDPDMVILNPLEYSIKDVTMYSALKENIQDQYLNVMIPNAGVASFTINGTSYSNRFSAVPGNSTYSFAQINLKQIGGTSFNLKSESGFNAMAYGFGDFESYAYSAGTNLASSIFINAVRPETNEIITNACRDEIFDFRLVLPYISTKLIWTLEPGDDPIVQDNPTYTVVTINGKLLYEYRLPADKVYDKVGTKQIKIISTIPPTPGGCPSGDEILNFDFEVYDPPPTATFLAQSQACINNPVKFNLNAINGNRPVISYFWDFGDGTTSTDKEPTHQFTTEGVKMVSLSVKNDVACISNVYQLPIEILKQPEAKFMISDVNCSKIEIKFTNQSTLNGNAPSYLWDFGDGTTSTDKDPVHSYSAGGTYQIKLTLKSSAGCESIVQSSKTVFEAPSADFDDPNACAEDEVTFITKNISSDVTTYLWNFGDGSAINSENSKSSPKHQFSTPGNYTVTLRVGNAKGCEAIISKVIVISSSNPKSQFSVLNDNNLCSNQPVQFQDLSSVQIGNIVRLEWIFDYSVGGPNEKETFQLPNKNVIYSHKYPSSKDTKNYQVLLRAYSGNDCFKDFGPITITVKGSPDVLFTPLEGICINKPKITFNQASETTGIAGSGIYTGNGVSENGVFDPVAAGVGKHNITYTFTSDNGCNDIKQQEIEVYPAPTINAGEDAVILIGGQTTLKSTASGNALTYQWLPSIGLSDPTVLNPDASPRETTLYTLIVTSADGCKESDQVNVIVAGEPKIPNTFTPNGDAVNDTWNIKYLDTYVYSRITIFNRFGNEVFTSIGYQTPWDGKSNGKDVPIGVYYYVIDPKVDGIKFTGSVTVIR